MTRRRRAAVLIGLAILLGSLAASDVARREAALREGVGPTVRILVARADVARGEPLDPARLATRRVPARWAPAGALTDPGEVAGLRAAGDLPRGADVTTAVVRPPDQPPGVALGLRPGERAAQVLAAAPPGGVEAGARVDVVITGDDAAGARLAISGAEVLAAEPAERAGGGPGVAATLRVTLRQALLLATAETRARDVRLLPRPVDQTSTQP